MGICDAITGRINTHMCNSLLKPKRYTHKIKYATIYANKNCLGLVILQLLQL